MSKRYTYDFDEITGEYYSRPANEFDGYDPVGYDEEDDLQEAELND